MRTPRQNVAQMRYAQDIFSMVEAAIPTILIAEKAPNDPALRSV